MYYINAKNVNIFIKKITAYKLNNCFLIKFNLFLWCIICHDPSEIILKCWFAAQETFLIIINVKNICAAYYFCANHNTFTLGFVNEEKVKKIAFMINLMHPYWIQVLISFKNKHICMTHWHSSHRVFWIGHFQGSISVRMLL